MNKTHRPTYRPQYRFSQPYTLSLYLQRDGESYLTEAQACEFLELNGGKFITRSAEGLLYWTSGQGNARFACEPVFISGRGWYYLKSELE
jgi:hypothetical protein